MLKSNPPLTVIYITYIVHYKLNTDVGINHYDSSVNLHEINMKTVSRQLGLSEGLRFNSLPIQTIVH